MDLLKVAIVLFVIILSIFFVLIGFGLLQDYRKNKEIEYLMYGVSFQVAATLILYLFFYIVKF